LLFLLALLLLPLFEGGNGSYGLLLGLVVIPLIYAWEVAFGTLKPNPRAILLWALFVLVCLLATTYLYPTLKATLWLLSAASAYALAAHYVGNRKLGGVDIVGTLVAASLLVALYGLFLYSPNLQHITPDKHLYSTFGLHNSYAAFLLLTWPLAFAMVRRQRGLSFILVGAILLLVLLLTFSRAAYMALAFQTLLLFFWVLMDYKRGSLNTQDEAPSTGTELRKKALYLTSGVVAAILVLLAFTGFYGSLTARLSSIWNAADYSLQGRLTFWSVAWSMFTRFPLFGVGWGNFGSHYTYLQPSWHYFATDAHGIVFKVMSEAGVWGLAFGGALVARYLSMLKTANALLRPGNLWPQRLMLTALAGFLAHALVDFDFTYLANVVFFAVLAAVSLGAVLSAEAVKKAVTSHRVWRIAVPLAMAAVALMGVLYVSERRGKEQEDLATSAMASWNASTQIGLALASLRENPPDFASAAGFAKQAWNLNTYESQAPYLMSQCPPAGGLEKRIEWGLRALELDPLNRPHYYWGLARLLRQAGNEEWERSILIQAMLQRYGDITEPITPNFPRPNWIENNITFASIYLRLAELQEDEHPVVARAYKKMGLQFQKANAGN
jgi:O-antigen ligase